jgi:hypothetical protein
MTKQLRMWSLSAVLGVAALSGGFTPSANALTVSFTARVYSLFGRTGILPTYGSTGGIAPKPGNASSPFAAEHEALSVEYNTSGLPYYVTSVVFNTATASGSNVAFAATEGGPNNVTNPLPFGQPITLASNLLSNASTSPTTSPVLSSGNKVLTQNFIQSGGVPQFRQGSNSTMFFYSRINTNGNEMAGTNTAFNLNDFSGTTVTVNLDLLSGATGFPATITLTGNFAIQTNNPPVVGDLDFGSTGANIDVKPTGVPEPGALASLLGMGVTGSLVVLRRRPKMNRN